MKKFILFAVIFSIAISFIGCNKVNEINSADTTPKARISTPDIKVPDKTYYGQWQIKKVLGYAPASTYSSDDVNTIIGKKLTFSKESATCFGDQISYLSNTAVNPTYKESVITKGDLITNYKITFNKLGIKDESIIQIDAVDSKGNGCTFFVKDKDTLILFGGGVYLELNKI